MCRTAEPGCRVAGEHPAGILEMGFASSQSYRHRAGRSPKPSDPHTCQVWVTNKRQRWPGLPGTPLINVCLTLKSAQPPTPLAEPGHFNNGVLFGPNKNEILSLVATRPKWEDIALDEVNGTWNRKCTCSRQVGAGEADVTVVRETTRTWDGWEKGWGGRNGLIGMRWEETAHRRCGMSPTQRMNVQGDGHSRCLMIASHIVVPF